MSKLHNYALFFFIFLFTQRVISQSTCSGSVHIQSEEGNITSNIGGYYSPNSNCTWYFSPPDANSTFITVNFTRFDLQTGDYVTVFDGPSDNYTKIFQHSSESVWGSLAILHSTQPYLTVIFTSNADYQFPGFTMFYQYQTGTPPLCSGTQQIYSQSILNVDFSSLNDSTQIECNWVLYPDPLDNSFYGYAYTYLASINDPSNALTIEVYAGISSYYEDPFAIYNTSSPLHQNSTGSFYFQEAALLVKLSGPASQATSFSLSYQFEEDEYDDDGGGFNNTGNIFAIVFWSVLSVCICCFAVAVFIGVEFELRRRKKHVICQSTCSGVQYKQNEQGYITSNIGGNYAAYSNCTWYFSPPSTNYTFITITFTQFDTEANWDYVNIFDGPSEAFPRIFQYSGTVLPSPVTLSSTQPDLTIVFTSDSIVQYSGFTIFYQYQTGTPPPCSGTREIYYGSTLDMVFPSLDASTQLECNWIIYSDDYDISYDYTAYTSLESISDPANALTIEVYAGTSIGYSPFVIYDSTSPLYQQSSYEFYSTTPNLYVKLSVYGGPASQPTSFSLSYEFDQGDYNGYSYPSTNDNFIAIFLGCFFGGFGFICLVVFSFVFCGRNRCGGGARTGGLFLFAWSSSRRNQDTITTTSVTQVPASHVTVTPQQQPELVQYVPMQSQQPQQAPAYLPPTNPELGLQTYPQQYYPPQPQPYVPVTVAYPGPVQTNPQQPLQSNPYLYYGPS